MTRLTSLSSSLLTRGRHVFSLTLSLCEPTDHLIAHYIRSISNCGKYSLARQYGWECVKEIRDRVREATSKDRKLMSTSREKEAVPADLATSNVYQFLHAGLNLPQSSLALINTLQSYSLSRQCVKDAGAIKISNLGKKDPQGDTEAPAKPKFSSMDKAKLRYAMNQFECAGHCIARCAEQLSLFPLHQSQVLTIAVMWCHKAKLRETAFHFARVLLRDRDLVKEVDAPHRKKIESVVRRHRKGAADCLDKPPQTSECPVCGIQVPEFALKCDKCLSLLPMCFFSGKHMSGGLSKAERWAECAGCGCLWMDGEVPKKEVCGISGSCRVCGRSVEDAKILSPEERKDELMFWLRENEDDME
eukprot:gnl/Carplike_NY0171/6437_a8843_219.p1 GENE.gnl/Carplike_NY0171/6437_a8843_219~~gnl/Carplike_NY0171/6437_a8843_219.p1  ORF type:complete len:360 (+),score=93.30 gnl/Carplike_NY0171/6437_a8843_219:169-1248(+)